MQMYANLALEDEAIKKLLKKKALATIEAIESAGNLTWQKNMSVTQAYKIVGVSRTSWYRLVKNQKRKGAGCHRWF
ncbi:hypothetical protein NT6N_26780 [Oceaniferula spumae]|uniref:Helix-turn-helix domain-containing protein n=1 Tax=Oceaniferula spumae TaxID=2979115 RepID=A0AAT9FNU5_9BACT